MPTIHDLSVPQWIGLLRGAATEFADNARAHALRQVADYLARGSVATATALDMIARTRQRPGVQTAICQHLHNELRAVLPTLPGTQQAALNLIIELATGLHLDAALSELLGAWADPITQAAVAARNPSPADLDTLIDGLSLDDVAKIPDMARTEIPDFQEPDQGASDPCRKAENPRPSNCDLVETIFNHAELGGVASGENELIDSSTPSQTPIITTSIHVPDHIDSSAGPNDLTAAQALRARSAWLVSRAIRRTPNVFITINFSRLPSYKGDANLERCASQAMASFQDALSESEHLAGNDRVFIAIAERDQKGGEGAHWHILAWLKPDSLQEACERLGHRFRKLFKLSVPEWKQLQEQARRGSRYHRLPFHIQTAEKPNQDRWDLEPYARRVGLSEAASEAKLAYMLKTLSGAAPAKINGIVAPLSVHRADTSNRLPNYSPSAKRLAKPIRISQPIDKEAQTRLGITAEPEFGWLDSHERTRRKTRPYVGDFKIPDHEETPNIVNYYATNAYCSTVISCKLGYNSDHKQDLAA